MNKKQLINENNRLKEICCDLAWMARRYADGRMSMAVSTYNNSVEELVKMGVYLKPDSISENTIWAKDGNGRQFDQLHDDHMLNTPVGRGEVFWPRGARLCDEITKGLGTSSPSEAAKEIKRLKALDNKENEPTINHFADDRKMVAIPKKRGRKPKNIKVN